MDNVENAFEELKSNGLKKEMSDGFRLDKHGETTWKVLFVIAPDGLCYCIGEKQKLISLNFFETTFGKPELSKS